MDSQQKLDKYLERLYTGKKISRPSDDPVIAMKGIGYRTEVSEVEQFKRNTNEVNTWMENSDAALDKATQAMHRMQELAVQASNGTYTESELESIKKEVDQLKEHLIDVANTSVNGKYIFNGMNTTEAPIVVDDNGNLDIDISEHPVEIEVFKGIRVQANVDATELFNEEFFENIDQFITGLENPEQADFDQSLENLDENLATLLDSRASLGARMNRLELVENRLDEQEIIAKQTMSENEDVHFEEAITDLITQETLHRAALSAGSRIIQPTLIDFLR